MKRLVILSATLGLLSFSMSACTGHSNGISNSAPDRTVSQPRRGSY